MIDQEKLNLHAREPFRGFGVAERAAMFQGSGDRQKKKVGAGIGATPTWGYCVCCYKDRRSGGKKVSAFGEININKYPEVNRNLRLHFHSDKKTLRLSGEGSESKERGDTIDDFLRHARNQFPHLQTSLVQPKLRLFYVQAKQMCNFFMGVAFNIVKEKNHFFGCW